MLIMPSFKKSLIVEQFQGNYLKTATILELVREISRLEKSSKSGVTRSCKKIKENKKQDVNQIPGTSSCSGRVARTHPHTWLEQKDLYTIFF